MNIIIIKIKIIKIFPIELALIIEIAEIIFIKIIVRMIINQEILRIIILTIEIE